MSRPTEKTIKQLFAVSGNQCAFPDCTVPLVDSASGTVLGEICHIKAQSLGGPRYDPNQNEKECHGFENLLLLCPTHHKIIDDGPATYPVERLREIKAQHEARYAGGFEPDDDVVRQSLTKLEIHGDVSGQVAVADHDIFQFRDVHGDVIIGVQRNQLRIPLQRPPRAEHFTGREKELEKLQADLQPGRVVTLCGSGGIGKTALAAEVVWTLAPGNEPPELFPDGIIFHSFYKQPKVELALEAIALAFGEKPRPTPRDAAQRALSGKRALLLLDGADNADNPSAVLDVRGGCGVLVTSRARSDAEGKWLDIIHPLTIDESMVLFQRWSGEQATDAPNVEQICKRVGRLPLAVRLAGRYIAETGETADEYLVWLQQTPLEALDQGQRRWKSVPVLLEKSLGQVSEEACEVLRMVGLLASASFDRAVLAAALDRAKRDLRKPLGELVNYSLLQHRDNRYEVTHALIHTYAREQSMPEPAAIRRLAEYYTTLAKNSKDAHGHSRLDAERAHLMRVLEECAEQKMWETTCDLVREVDNYLDLCGYWNERKSALRAGIQAAEASGDHEGRGAFLGSLGSVYGYIGQIQLAIKYHKQALDIAHNTEDRGSEGNALGNLGVACRDLGQMKQAIEYHEQALGIARNIKDHQGEGTRLNDLGLTHYFLGEVEQAIDRCSEALTVARKIDPCEIDPRKIDPRDIAGTAMAHLGLFFRAEGKMEQAIDYCEGALEIAREIGNRGLEGYALANLGKVYESRGQLDCAVEYYEQSIDIARAISDRRGEGNRLGNLGRVYCILEKIDIAIDHHILALGIAREIENRRSEGNRLADLGNDYLMLGQVKRAIDYYEQALTIAREVDDQRREGTGLDNLGKAYHKLGQVKRAIDYYEQALAIACEIDDRRGKGTSLGDLGNAYRDLKQVERAIDYYEQALAIAHEISDRRNEGVYLSDLGSAYRDLKQAERAVDYHHQALVINREIGYRQGEATDLGNLGSAYFLLKDYGQAADYYRQQQMISQEIDNLLGQGNALWGLATCAEATGQLPLATDQAQAALTIFTAIKSPNAQLIRDLLAKWEDE